MSRPNSWRRHLWNRRLRTVLLTGALALPVYATSAASQNAAGPESITLHPANAAGGAEAESLSPTYHLRCWQYGRLIIEETGVDSPTDKAGQVLVLRQATHANLPLYLIETQNSTCVLKAAKP